MKVALTDIMAGMIYFVVPNRNACERKVTGLDPRKCPCNILARGGTRLKRRALPLTSDSIPPAPVGSAGERESSSVARWTELYRRLPETLKIEISWDRAFKIEISTGWLLLLLLVLLMW